MHDKYKREETNIEEGTQLHLRQHKLKQICDQTSVSGKECVKGKAGIKEDLHPFTSDFLCSTLVVTNVICTINVSCFLLLCLHHLYSSILKVRQSSATL